MADRPLEGQHALITGASSGIGKAIAYAFADAGAAVLINYLSDEAEAERIAKDIGARGGRAVPLRGDVAEPGGCAHLFDTMEERLGGVDIVVANAGIQRDQPFVEMTREAWQKVIDVNLTGQFLCAQEAVRRFRRRGQRPGAPALGKIIFTSSVHQAIPWAGHANYAVAKAGLKMLMETMAQELAPEKIRVNGIAPGAIKTPINRESWEDPEARAELLEKIPYGRVGEPEDVARAAVWLASDDSDYVVGATLFIDGGMMLYPSFREGG